MSADLGVIIGVAMLFIVGYLVLKGKYPPMVLFSSGVFMLFCAVLLKTGFVLPKAAHPSGNSYLDIVEFVRFMFSSKLAHLGLIVMVMVGFASYMTFIGANDAFVRIIIKPLGAFKSPYLMVFFAYLLAKCVSMVITSAVGLGVLCMALMGPALVALGVHRLAVGAVCASSGAVSLVLLGGSTAASAAATKLSILDYVFLYKIPAGLPTILAIALTHALWQRYLDKKEGYDYKAHIGESLDFDDEVSKPLKAAPLIYALLPFLPMILVVLFSKYAIKGIKLDITSLVLLSLIIGLVFEALRFRSFDRLCEGLKVFLSAMGRAMSGVVSLIIAAGVFAQGFKALGLLNAILDLASTAGLGGLGMSLLFVGITVLITIIAGSNGASFYPLVEMMPTIASKLGVPAVSLVLPMHQASTLARPLSPISGVMVAISGMLKCSVFDLIKRTSVPMIVGLVVHQVMVYVSVL